MLTRASVPWLWIAVGISFGLSLFPWGAYVLYPFRIFTTWAHECAHAAMATLLGGSVRGISIFTDASGLTEFSLAASRWRQSLVASSGYLGASFLGCLLLASTRAKISAPAVMWGVGAVMLVTLLLWVRSFFGVVSVAVLGAALIALGRQGRGPLSEFLLQLLSVQTALNAFFDIRTLFSLSSNSASDAATMSGLLWLPPWFWALAWMATNVGMLVLTWKLSGQFI